MRKRRAWILDAWEGGTARVGGGRSERTLQPGVGMYQRGANWKGRMVDGKRELIDWIHFDVLDRKGPDRDGMMLGGYHRSWHHFSTAIRSSEEGSCLVIEPARGY